MLLMGLNRGPSGRVSRHRKCHSNERGPHSAVSFAHGRHKILLSRVPALAPLVGRLARDRLLWRGSGSLLPRFQTTHRWSPRTASCQARIRERGGIRSRSERVLDCRALLVHCSAMRDTLTIRIDAALKRTAERTAAENDETLSQVVRRALRDYVQQRGQSGGPNQKTHVGLKRS
jgi:hypothetical protein